MQADRSAANSKFLEGEAPLWATSLTDLDELGVGVSLYMRILKYLAIMFGIMTVLSLPALYVSAVGMRSGETAVTLSRLSIAEAGPQVRGTLDCRLARLSK